MWQLPESGKGKQRVPKTSKSNADPPVHFGSLIGMTMRYQMSVVLGH